MKLEEGDLDSDHDREGGGGGEPPAGSVLSASEKEVEEEYAEDDGAGPVQPESELLSEETGFAHASENVMADMDDNAGVEGEAAHPKCQTDDDYVAEEQGGEGA